MPRLNDSAFVQINGRRQYLTICSNYANKPILLYLHGGPGDAALPLLLKYNRSLEEYFTVVVWEQRGTGKSYYPFEKDEKITIPLFLEDIDAIARYLFKKYRQKKLYLAGHSWGSVLGLMYCQLHPEQITAYIGCGQVVNMQKSSRLAWEYALQAAQNAGDTKTYSKLKSIDCTYSSESWLNALLFVTRQVVKYGGSLYGHKNYSPFVKAFLFSKAYSPADLVRRQKGSLQSIQRLWPELMAVNFESVTQFSVPIVFVAGRHDHHVSSCLTKAYFDTITTEKQFFWFENACHFPQWSEPEHFAAVLRSVLNSYA